MANVLLLVMALAIVVLAVALVLVRQYYASRERARERWQQTLLLCAEALQHALDHVRQQPDWAGILAELLAREFDAAGALIGQRARAGTEARTTPLPLRIIATTGACREWKLGGDPADTGLEAGVPEDFFWSRRPIIYGADRLREWLPAKVSGDFTSGLIAPVATPRSEVFVIVLRHLGQPEFNSDDQTRLGHCLDVAGAGFHTLEAEADRRSMERALNSAHEEGMLQISTGIIHNIGNGITVIQIALERLQSGDFKSVKQLTEFIDGELLPEMRRHLEAGDIQTFLTNHVQGREYLTSLKALHEEILKLVADHDKELQFVVDKFRNVTEIITLQQQFIGELGTENVVPVNAIIDGVLKMCQDPINQRAIELKTGFAADSRILVDPAMLRHIVLLLVKHAIEAASATRRAKPMIRLRTWEGPLEGEAAGKTEGTPMAAQLWVNISVADNGAGGEVVLNEEDLVADRQNVDERLRDLFFCKRRIEKYGGRLDIETDFGHGTQVTIRLPPYDETQKPPAVAQPGPEPQPEAPAAPADAVNPT